MRAVQLRSIVRIARVTCSIWKTSFNTTSLIVNVYRIAPHTVMPAFTLDMTLWDRKWIPVRANRNVEPENGHFQGQPIPYRALCNPERGVSMLLRNVGARLQDYTMSQPR
jgi:hypothetical protein